MPRNVGTNIYYIPPGTEGFPDTTIESEKYNNYIHDVETDLNLPRPISAGGTGATSADGALTSLHAEKAGQEVENFDTHVWIAGSFYSAINATAPPVALHAFSGIAHITDADNMVVEAVDLTDPLHKSYMRVKTAGVWGAWEGVSIVTCADDPPTGNRGSDNALWFESSTGLLYIRYNDGDSSQWTIACPQPDISSYLFKTGDTMTGNLSIAKVNPYFTLNKSASGEESSIYGATNGLSRWALILGNSGGEVGGNIGSDFVINRYDDAGNPIDPVFLINRASGLAQVKADPAVGLGIATKQYVDARGTLYLQNSVVFDPPSLATNVVGVIQTLTITGAAVGDFCLASFSTDLNGMTLLAWVSAANTTSFQFQNKTAGTLDLASGTVRVRVWK